MVDNKNKKKEVALDDVNVLHAQPFAKITYLDVLNVSYQEPSEDFLEMFHNSENDAEFQKTGFSFHEVADTQEFQNSFTLAACRIDF